MSARIIRVLAQYYREAEDIEDVLIAEGHLVHAGYTIKSSSHTRSEVLMTPKTVQLFLLDGTPTGPIKCSLSNWTGKVFLIPRTDLKNLSAKRNDLEQNGVYLLFGTEENTDRSMVYVGQARARVNGRGLAGRIEEHSTDRLEYFTHAIMVTTTDDSFGPTEISYLENRFYTIAKDAERFELANNNLPSIGNVTEEKKAELDEFIEYTKIAVGSLGYKVFQPIDERSSSSEIAEEPEPTTISPSKNLVLSSTNFAAAGRQTSDGFIVLKGSRIRENQSATCPTSRETYLERHRDAIQDFVLTKDVLFNSPSTAGMFVSGRSINGLTAWKTTDGRTLKSLEDES